jgi:hypothetical protein
MRSTVVYKSVKSGASSHKSIEFALPNKVFPSRYRWGHSETGQSTGRPVVIITTYVVGRKGLERVTVTGSPAHVQSLRD